MTDVSGIPNMGFGGGSYFGGIPNQASAMSSPQINASMGWNPNAAQFNPFANSGGFFGAQPAAYAGAGAAYGRATGGFGGAPGRVGTIGNPGTSNPGYNPGGGGASSWLGGAYPAGDVQRGQDLQAPAWVDPFSGGTGGGGWGGGGGGYTPPAMQSPARSPFTGFGFGGNRDFLAALMRNNASPTPPALHSQNPAAANSFLQSYQNMPPQSQITNRFGGFQPPEWSAEGITLGDKLRQQQPGIYANSPFGN